MLAGFVWLAERVSIGILFWSRFRLPRLHLHVIHVFMRDGGLRNPFAGSEGRPKMWTEGRNQEIASLTEKEGHCNNSCC